MTRVVGFGYQARQGKDTCVDAIVSTPWSFPLPLDVRRYALADALKLEVSLAITASGGVEGLFAAWHLGLLELPPRPEWVEIDQNPPPDPLCVGGKQRTLLMFWGTEYRRAQDPDYWVRKLDARIHYDNPDWAIISDIRFPNELRWIKSMGGTAVHVTRPGYKLPSSHATETSLLPSDFDYTLTSHEGDIPKLQRHAQELFHNILQGAWNG